MQREPAVVAFLASLEEVDGFPPLSEAKLAVLGDLNASVLITEEDRIVAIGTCARHLQADGTARFALETAVERSMRFPHFEAVVLDAALELVPDRRTLSIWSNRPSLDRVVESMGFTMVRSLAFMTVDLPISDLAARDAPYTARTFTEADVGGLVAANRLAFTDHREAASLSDDDVLEMMGQSWFDAGGIFLVEDAEQIVGFCWTRVHDNGDGEIYRIGVVPDRAGTGVGRALLSAGFGYLTERQDVRRGVLWVDRSSERAVNLYRSVGMQTERTVREFEQC